MWRLYLKIICVMRFGLRVKWIWRFTMPPFLQFVIRRLLVIPLSLLIITMILYAGVMLTPPAARARLYLPPGRGGERATQNVINGYVKQYHLDEPYPVNIFLDQVW
jgi:ABC-type dipeptide/oligopeptide/nickel transport system permease component